MDWFLALNLGMIFKFNGVENYTLTGKVSILFLFSLNLEKKVGFIISYGSDHVSIQRAVHWHQLDRLRVCLMVGQISVQYITSEII